MRHRLRSFALVALAVAPLAAACGDDDPTPVATTQSPSPAPTTAASPSPLAGITFTTGNANFEITGDENVTIDAQLDAGAGATLDPSSGDLQLEYRGGDDGLLRMTLTFVGPTLDDAFVAIGLGGELAGDENYYYDGFHTQCEVTTDPLSPTGLSGSFTCDDLPEDSGATIDVTGTFSASP